MDEVSQKCLTELASSVLLRLIFMAFFLLVSRGLNGASILQHFALLLPFWIIAEGLFVFLPNYIRHQRRWKHHTNYRQEALASMHKIGGLKTIYSDLLDRYPV